MAEIGDGRRVEIVSRAEFQRHLPNATKVVRRQFYCFAEASIDGVVTVLVANAQNISISELDRDTTWRRRRELASELEARFNGDSALTPGEVRGVLTLTLVLLSYLELFPANTTLNAVLLRLCQNTQDRFDRRVQSYRDNVAIYDVGEYTRSGVYGNEYSHVDHFSWLYNREFRYLAEAVAQRGVLPIRILDLGAGNCHFLATTASYFGSAWVRRHLHLTAVDCDREALSRGEVITRQRGIDVEFVVDDFTADRFHQRLASWRPDVMVVNHVIEYYEYDAQTRYLLEWFRSIGTAIVVAVPLGDRVSTSISQHQADYSAESFSEFMRSVVTACTGADGQRLVLNDDIAGMCLVTKP
jgi:hypothetical protein